MPRRKHPHKRQPQRAKRIRTTREVAEKIHAEERLQGTALDRTYYQSVRDDEEAREFIQRHPGLFLAGPSRTEAEEAVKPPPQIPTALWQRIPPSRGDS